jgi:hypothetical protein
MNLPIRPEASNRKERLCWIRGITLNASTAPLHLLQGTGHLPAFLLFTRNKKPFMSPKINQPSAETPMKLALTREEAARALGISTATIDRLTERCLLKPSRATRRPLYPVFELKRFLKETQAKPRVRF